MVSNYLEHSSDKEVAAAAEKAFFALGLERTTKTTKTAYIRYPIVWQGSRFRGSAQREPNPPDDRIASMPLELGVPPSQNNRLISSCNSN